MMKNKSKIFATILGLSLILGNVSMVMAQSEETTQKKLKIKYHYVYTQIEREIFKNFEDIKKDPNLVNAEALATANIPDIHNLPGKVQDMPIVLPGHGVSAPPEDGDSKKFSYGETDRVKGAEFYTEDFELPQTNEEIKEKILKRIESNEKNNPVSAPLIYDPTLNSEIVSNSSSFIENMGDKDELVLNVWMRRVDDVPTKKNVETSEIGVNTDFTMPDIQRMEEEVRDLKEQLHSLHELIERLRTEKQELGQDKERIISSLTREVERLQAEVTNNPSADNLQEELARTKRELANISSELEKQLNEKSTLEGEVGRLREEISTLGNDVANKSGIISAQEREIERLRNDLKTLQAEKDGISNSLADKNRELASLNEQIQRLQQQLDALRETESSNNPALQAELEKLRNKIEELQNAKTNLEDEVRVLQEQLKEKENQLKEKSNEVKKQEETTSIQDKDVSTTETMKTSETLNDASEKIWETVIIYEMNGKEISRETLTTKGNERIIPNIPKGYVFKNPTDIERGATNRVEVVKEESSTQKKFSVEWLKSLMYDTETEKTVESKQSKKDDVPNTAAQKFEFTPIVPILF